MDRAPFMSASDTSRLAAASVGEHLARLEAMVLDAIKSAGEDGMTRDEIETATGLAGNCVRPRVWSLMKRGLVRTNGQRRKTTSGRHAEVLVA